MEPPPPAPAKLRLMCSYGGRVSTRPHNPKTPTYVGGETRIVTIDRATTGSTLASLTAHLSAALSIPSPFALKYLLPSTDLDSLISIVSDDDLVILLDELDRLMSSPSRLSRIRLFVFGEREEKEEAAVGEVEERRKVGSIRHPKTETWFSDALKGARLGCGGGEGGAESVVLETSSSFGSTSSSLSHSSLPALGCSAEESKGRSGMADASSRENSASSGISNLQTGGGPYNEGMVHAATFETQASPFGTYEVKSQVPYLGIEQGKTIQVPGYPLPQQYNQLRHVQYVPVGMPYGIENHPPMGMPHQQPYCPAYHVQPPPPDQPLHFYYPQNQPYPVYVVPVVPAPQVPYGLPMPGGSGGSATIDYGQPLLHPVNPMVNPQMWPLQAVPLVENKQKLEKLQPIPVETQPQPQSPPQPKPQPKPLISVEENNCYDDQFEDDPARFQIYKTQPLPAVLPTQYQTMAEATTLMLTEALTQLNTGKDKQQQS
ncbi:hypothetical protein MLD38_001561 [Melastoma candidum]|uniref:Uncharacterized protein n=1 Tax=Melastoma candidum TaxID=119954 RepID=A0ACB9SD32_9MYRT|nr:hypothetical protein MLD38_001561 [Melastoma candidum]